MATAQGKAEALAPRGLRQGRPPAPPSPAGLTLVRGAGAHRRPSEPRVRTSEQLRPGKHAAGLLCFEPAISLKTLAVQDLRTGILHSRR